MKYIIDNSWIDSVVDDKLIRLQSKLDSQCNVQIVMKNMTHDEKDAIMKEVEW